MRYSYKMNVRTNWVFNTEYLYTCVTKYGYQNEYMHVYYTRLNRLKI